MAEIEIGILQMPKEILDVINQKKDHDEKPDDFSSELYNNTNYLRSFKRFIDIPLICLFYGLYKSKDLPPELYSEMAFGYTFEFGAVVTKQIDLFNNLLFALWVKQNPIPKEYTQLVKYRERLYAFLERLEDPKYIIKVMIPFYLQKANEPNNETSFVNRLKFSGYVKYEPIDYSPEYLTLEFFNLQKEFMVYLKIEEVEKSELSIDVDKLAGMKEVEITDQLDHRVDNIEIKLRQLIKSRMNEHNPQFWDKFTNHDLKEDVEKRIKSTLHDNPMIKESDIDIFDFFTIFNYKSLMSEFWVVFEPIFRSKSDMKDRFEDLTKLRNALKHNRELTTFEVKEGDVVLMWFEEILKNY